MKRIVLPLLATVVGATVVGLWLSRTGAHSMAPIKGRVDMVEADADPELAAAVIRAQKELPRFIETLNSPKADQRQFAVNARFSTPKGFEQIWVRVTAFRDGFFEGTLADEPYAVPNRHKGDSVQVPKSSVCDWTFLNGSKVAGGYTMQVLLRRQAANQGK